MIYRITPRIFEQFPDFCRGVVVASNIDNSSPANSTLQQLLDQRIGEIATDASISDEHPKIQAWYAVYKTFSIARTKKIKPSIAALVQWIKSGRRIPFISPLVCISNLISLTYLVPSGLVDAEKVTGDLVLAFAQGTEHFSPIGSDETSFPEQDEIIYYDTGSQNVMCRAWNSRGGKATAIQPRTHKAVIDVDGLLSAITRNELEIATHKMASLVTEHCGATANVYFLDKMNHEIRFSLD
ncbi:hypothetical protein HYR54_07430 [Candidatus Acetothermia bacterium]|nr:hypothetical protein [Candidatus Acetothermia bacterium]